MIAAVSFQKALQVVSLSRAASQSNALNLFFRLSELRKADQGSDHKIARFLLARRRL